MVYPAFRRSFLIRNNFHTLPEQPEYLPEFRDYVRDNDRHSPLTRNRRSQIARRRKESHFRVGFSAASSSSQSPFPRPPAVANRVGTDHYTDEEAEHHDHRQCQDPGEVLEDRTPPLETRRP